MTEGVKFHFAKSFLQDGANVVPGPIPGKTRFALDIERETCTYWIKEILRIPWVAMRLRIASFGALGDVQASMDN